MPISFSAPTLYNSNDTSKYTHAVNLPSANAGEIILLIAQSNLANFKNSTPSGFTEISVVNSTLSRDYGIWAKVADGNEGSTINLGTGGSNVVSYAFILTGASTDFSAWESTHLTHNGVNAPYFDPPSLTVTGGLKEYAWVAAVFCPASTAFTGAPANYSGFTEQLNVTTDGDDLASAVAYRILEAETEDPGSFSSAAETTSVGVTLAIPPAATGPQEIRKSSTFDVETALGTITTATLNSVNVFDHVTGQVGTTVSFESAATDEIATSGEYTLTLGDGTGTEDITVQVNVVGLPSNTARKDGALLTSLTDLTLDAFNASGTLVKSLTGVTTNASGVISPVDLSDISEAVGDILKVSLHSATSDVGVTFEQPLELI